jgi:hypothetical protein
MWSGLPRHVSVGAHDSGQVLTFQGKSCPGFGAFTTFRVVNLLDKFAEVVLCLLKRVILLQVDLLPLQGLEKVE